MSNISKFYLDTVRSPASSPQYTSRCIHQLYLYILESGYTGETRSHIHQHLKEKERQKNERIIISNSLLLVHNDHLFQLMCESVHLQHPSIMAGAAWFRIYRSWQHTNSLPCFSVLWQSHSQLDCYNSKSVPEVMNSTVTSAYLTQITRKGIIPKLELFLYVPLIYNQHNSLWGHYTP